MRITVSICTYNGEHRVPDVLKHLEVQKHLEDVQWEVVVVDNNSTDDTEGVVRDVQESWDRSADLRYIREERQGLTYARERAIDEARGTWVAFLDDDNLPAPDWMAQAVRFAETHPGAGAFGGRLIGEYEVDPPPSFGLVQGLFAINEASETFSYSEMGTGAFSPGAGLVVRKEVWKEEVSDRLESTGVSGESRADVGEDLEAQWYIHEAGWEVWHNADMVAVHKIPKHRFDDDYLDGFFKGIGCCRHRLRMLRYERWQQPFIACAYWLSDLRKLIALSWQHRRDLDDRFVRGRMQMRGWMLVRPFMWID